VVDLSIVIVNYNTRDLLVHCLRSVFVTLDVMSAEVWVVDNASTDGSSEMVVASFPKVRLIRNAHNVGFAAANNQALCQTEGRFLFLLNSDATLLPNSLLILRETLVKQESLGICGPCLLNPDGSIQPSWGDFPTPTTEFLFQSFLFKLWPCRFPYGRRIHFLLRPTYQRFQWVDWVTGAAFMLRREVFDQVGGLPEGNFMYGEDLEYCVRARQAGFKVAYVPTAKVYHHLQVSSRRDYSRWIENYSRATLSYYLRYGSVADCQRTAYLIILGLSLIHI
jgi:N-acetylglucosaminyl-diphospho-decaprenol L-rhamnosyltransferase